MKLLAIDLGYSSVKVAFYNEEGVIKLDKYISATAKLDNPIEVDDDSMFKLGAEYFVLGTPALKVPRSFLMPLETFDDLKAVYPVWISYLLKKYGDVDHVIIGLSMQFSDKTDELLNHLYDVLLIQRDNYFMCFPQGLSCKFIYAEAGLNTRESSKKNDFRMNSYLVLDGGYLTCDIASVINGNASAGSAIGIAGTGVICISYDVVDYLYKEYNMQISLKEAQVIVDSDGIFTKRGRKYDISEKVKEFTKKYIKNVLDMLESKFSENLDSAEGILVCGGLAYFFRKYIEDPDIVKEIEKHFPVSYISLPEVDSEYYNVQSYLKGAEKMLNSIGAQ